MKRFFKWTGIGCGGLIVLVILLMIIAALFADEDSNDGPSLPPTPQLSNIPFGQLTEMAERISYDELFRHNEDHIGKLVRYRGQIIQVQEGRRDSYVLRANVTEGQYLWEDPVYLNYSGSRLLEDDVIEFVGRVQGLKTYQAIFGNSVTIPEINIVQARLIPK